MQQDSEFPSIRNRITSTYAIAQFYWVTWIHKKKTTFAAVNRTKGRVNSGRIYFTYGG